MRRVFNDLTGIPRTNIEGVDRVMSEINRKITRMVDYGSLKGILKAIAYVRRDMDKTYPRIPVDWGNLRASFFVTSSAGSIAMGGGKSHTPEGNEGNFSGPLAPKMSAEHATTLTEMKTVAKTVSKIYGGPAAVFGFSANYAMWVHEMWDPEVKWKRKQSGPGFFVVHLERNKDKMLQIIRDNSIIT